MVLYDNNENMILIIQYFQNLNLIYILLLLIILLILSSYNNVCNYINNI